MSCNCRNNQQDKDNSRRPQSDDEQQLNLSNRKRKERKAQRKHPHIIHNHINLTVGIRHSSVILIFHKHVAKLYLSRIQILARDIHLSWPSTPGLPRSEDVAHLVGEPGFKNREFMLLRDGEGKCLPATKR